MESADVRRLALVLALQAEIEGMKAENIIRESRGEALAYPGSMFTEAADELRNLAASHDEQL